MSHEQRTFVLARWLWRRVVSRWLIDLRISGLEHVPREGAYIVAANHLSMVDIPLMMTVLPRRPSIMMKRELYDIRALTWFWRWGDAIPVNRGTVDRTALRAVADRIARGIPFGIFPECTRSRGGALIPSRAGTGLIALRSRVPVVPLAYTGTPDILRGNRPHLRARVTMTIGPAIPPEELAAAGGAEAATELVMRRIAAILPPEMRGVYADPEPSETVRGGMPAT